MTPRTRDSLIFNVPARQIDSEDPRFLWSLKQEKVFLRYIQNHLDTYGKPGNLEILLQRLDLDGYDAIRTDRGEHVHGIIVKKVYAKMMRMRRKAGLRVPDPSTNANSGPAANKKSTKTDSPAAKANSGPGNQFLAGYNINIIDPSDEEDGE
ncbi:hypothetical protein F4823DRAFT_3206 [Ustulina deusta]|nr:hypothetical protein F4823DRAFT_3206 [Ustulina deusta]